MMLFVHDSRAYFTVGRKKKEEESHLLRIGCAVGLSMNPSQKVVVSVDERTQIREVPNFGETDLKKVRQAIYRYPPFVL